MPTVPDVSESTARHVVGVICFLACMLISYLASRFVSLWLVIIILLISAWVSASCIYWIDGSVPAEIIHRLLMSLRPRLPMAHEGPHDRTSAASGVVAGSLVYLDKDYKQLLANRRAKHGRSAEPPDVPYHLVLATYKVNGNEQVVAFSDGTSAAWHPTNKVVLSHVEDSWWRPERNNETGAAAALCDLIAFLFEAQQGMSVRAIYERLSGHLGSNVDRALDAAKPWRMISEDGRLGCRITRAGLHWHLASEEFEMTRLLERKNMSKGSNGASNFNIYNSGVFNYAGNDIAGEHKYTVHNAQLSDPQLLAYVNEVLDSTEIPGSTHS